MAMSRGRVVRCQREPYDVYIGRAVPRFRLAASKWANPFRAGYDGDRCEAIANYERWLSGEPELMARSSSCGGRHSAAGVLPPLSRGAAHEVGQ
jgi:hypothetical protein